MIEIVITRTTVKDVTVTKNFLKSETPTGEKGHYGDSVTAKTYDVHDVVEKQTEKTELLRQAILVEADFDMAAVIRAINKLK